MALPRRVQLTPLPADVGSCAVNGTVLAPKSPPERGGGSRPTTDCVPGSVRLVIALFEPDERSFSEFSYTQLLENKVNCEVWAVLDSVVTSLYRSVVMF